MHSSITHIAQNQGQKNAVKKKKDKNNAAACDNAEKKIVGDWGQKESVFGLTRARRMTDARFLQQRRPAVLVGGQAPSRAMGRVPFDGGAQG